MRSVAFLVRYLPLVLFCASGLCRAETAIPPHSDAVVDEAQILSKEIAIQLSASLKEFQREFGPQIQLLTVKELDGEPIESYSIRVASQWKLGDQKRDDGVLLVIAVKNKAVRIEVGQGLEGTLPDLVASRIIRETIVPFFKANRYSDGVTQGLVRIAQSLGGELRSIKVISRPRQSIGMGWLFLFVLFLILFSHFLARNRSGASGFIAGMLLDGLLRGGDRNSGGGFGGGGGGGFSGGGASGNW